MRAPMTDRRHPRRTVLLRALTALVALTAVGLVTTPASAAGQPSGMDISGWQHLGGRTIDWDAVRATGQAFTIVKATEAASYRNPYFVGDWRDAQQVGMVVGAYHYARPSRPVVSDAVSEARFYVSTAGTLPGPGVLPPILDLEENGGLNPSEMIHWTQTWLDTVKQLTGRDPMIYTYRYFWSHRMAGTGAFTAYPLWLADYNPTFGGTVGGWPVHTLWQYTAGAHVPGVYGVVDMSRFNGSISRLFALADGAPVPQPAATPPLPPAPVVAGPVDVTGSAVISWQMAFDGGSPVTSYVVTAQPGGQTLAVNPAQNSAALSGLDPAVAYTFTVIAINDVGSSSPASSAGPFPGPPTSPTPIPTPGPTPTPTPSPTVIDNPAPVRTGTSLSVVASATTIAYGGSVRLTARLSRADTQAPAADRAVLLESRPSSSGVYVPVTALQSGADGSVSYAVAPRSSTVYRFRYAGTDTEAGSSATATVAVSLRIAGTLSRRVGTVGQRLTLSGHVSALRAGFVYRQQLINGTWTTLARARVTHAGAFAFAVVPVVKGVKVYRVRVPRSSSYASTVSSALRLTVR